jgi:hypothetical protein
VILTSCNKEDVSYETLESTSYTIPVFIGNDSILHFEHYIRQKPIKAGLEEWWIRINIIDSQGKYISTIWQKNLFENSTEDYWTCFCLDFAEDSKTLTICCTDSDYGESTLYEILVIDLDGNIVSRFVDKDIEKIASKSLDQGNSIHVSPNGMYYAITNKIKNMSGETLKVIADTIVDWNTTGLLVRNQATNTEIIDIEGIEYSVYSHPNAQFWYGQDFHYLRIVQDTVMICNLSDSSVLKKVWFGDYNNYVHWVGNGNLAYPQYPQYIHTNMMSSSISPDSEFLLLNYIGISLLNLKTGESKMIKEAIINQYKDED